MNILNGLSVNITRLCTNQLIFNSFPYVLIVTKFFSSSRNAGIIYKKNHDFVGETKLSLQVRQGMLNDAGFNNYENEITFYNILFAFPTVVIAFNNDVFGRTFN